MKKKPTIEEIIAERDAEYNVKAMKMTEALNRGVAKVEITGPEAGVTIYIRGGGTINFHPMGDDMSYLNIDVEEPK